MIEPSDFMFYVVMTVLHGLFAYLWSTHLDDGESLVKVMFGISVVFTLLCLLGAITTGIAVFGGVA